MPLNPQTQTKNRYLQRRLLDLLKKDGGSPVNETTSGLLVQAERHLLGLFDTLNQLDARFEKRAWDLLASYFSNARPPRARVSVAEDPIQKETRSTRKRTDTK